MKKVLIFCLILLCTLSVFAADIAAKVSLYFSYGSDGFGFSFNRTWEPVMKLSLTGDKAGASFSWCPIDYKNSCYGFDVLIRPKDSVEFQVGANLSASFVKGFSLDNIMAYGIIKYDNLYKNGVIAQFGVGYQPESLKKLFNADVFIAGCFNYLNKEIGTFHFDGLTKLNIESKKPSLDYSLSEVSFNRFVVSGNCVENANTDRIVAITEKFNFDEAYYFDHESRSREHDSWCTGNFNTGFVAGLRYKYFTEAEKTVYNGFYGYGLGSYALENSVSFEVEAEVGRYAAELEIESRGIVSETTEKFYSQYTFDWADGKLDATITDISLYLAHPVTNKNGSINVYMQSNYKNLNTNSVQDNGFFFNPGIKTTIDKCDLDVGVTVGFDSLKNFSWNAQSTFSYTDNP